MPRPTAPCPPRAPILLTDCFLCRWSLPMAMSITHRGTGVALSLGVCTSGCCGLQSCGCWRSFISPCLSSCNSAFSRGFCSLLPPHSPPHTPSAAAAPGSDAVLCLNPQSLRSTASMVSCCLLPHLPPRGNELLRSSALLCLPSTVLTPPGPLRRAVLTAGRAPGVPHSAGGAFQLPESGNPSGGEGSAGIRSDKPPPHSHGVTQRQTSSG